MQISASLTLAVGLVLTAFSVQGQTRPAKAASSTKTTPLNSKLPEFSFTRAEVEAHVRFLASDELEGRRTGEKGNWTAARYIAEQFRQLGLKPAGDQGDYFQRINFEKIGAATSAMMLVGKDTLKLGKELVVMAGKPTDVSGEVMYVGYGLTDGEDGYKGRDVKGRILVAQGGSPDAKGPREIFSASAAKRKLATEKGAAALIELYSESIPWGFVNQYFSREQVSLPTGASGATPSVAHVWVNNANNQYKQLKEAGQKRDTSNVGQASGRCSLSQRSGNY